MSSIPLPALHINPPPDPTEGIQRMVQLKQMIAMAPGQQQLQQQQIQAGAQENQLRQTQIQDQQAMTQAMKEWKGNDFNELPGLVLKHGGSAQTVMSLRTNLVKQQQDLANLSKDQLANISAVNDQLLGHIDTLKGITDPVQRSMAAKQTAGQVLNSPLGKMLDPQTSQMIQGMAAGQFVPDDEQLSTFEKGLTAHSKQIEQTFKQAETEKNVAQAGQAKANQAKLEAELKFYQAKGMAPGVPLDVQEASDWLSKNPGKGPADYMAYKAKLVPAFNFNLQNTGTTGDASKVAQRFGYSPVAFDQAAEKYWQTGQLPPTGRGGPALAANKAIQNRAAELHPEGSLAANSAEYKANTHSLENLQKMFDSVNAFENTAIKNLDQVAKAGADIPDLGVRFANIPVRMISDKMIGTPEMARFRTALLTAQTESARVLNTANASGVLSDDARKEAQKVLNGDLPFPAMMASINQLKTDFRNRHQSYSDQISDIKKRLGGKSQQEAQSPSGQDGMIRARDPQGKLHEAPAGTPLPQGWTLEK